MENQTASSGHQATDQSELNQLRQQLQAAQQENAHLLEHRRRLMEVLNCKSPDRLEHDLRNVMNELNLLRTIVETDE